ncbi:uncharacterized protein LOC143235096 isoform X4 [Tachypleus tridentatus]|uniref:uncharacterized protein LOC143235096 isoform X4 n=1 Tax=Tachypleus tridentatus TaxID=6853 RepID=UPI003FD16F64
MGGRHNVAATDCTLFVLALVYQATEEKETDVIGITTTKMATTRRRMALMLTMNVELIDQLHLLLSVSILSWEKGKMICIHHTLSSVRWRSFMDLEKTWSGGK